MDPIKWKIKTLHQFIGGYVHVRPVKAAREEAALSSAARRSPWQPSHSPPPKTLSTHHWENPVCEMFTYPKV